MTNRAALVTGGSSGIGLAVATRLARRGYGVTLVGRSVDKLADAVDSVRASVADASVHGVPADLADPSQNEVALAAHLERAGRLDVLVAAAGTGTGGSLADSTWARADRMFAVNVRGPLQLLGASIPHLRTAGRDHATAWVVLISSIAAVTPTPGFAVYSATKAALRSLASSLNAELASDGVRACAVCPGFVDTPMAAWAREKIPVDAMIQPDDIGHLVDMLLDLSPNAVVDELVVRRVGARLGEP